jgi:hypothetical protein
MVRSQTKIRKTLQANMLLEQRYLTKENFEELEPEEFDTPLEDEPSLFDDEEDDIEDFGFDIEDDEDFDDLEGFDKEMKFKDTMKKNKLGSVGIGAGTRWDKDSEKEYSPIKDTDLPLDKFLKSKYNKK